MQLHSKPRGLVEADPEDLQRGPPEESAAWAAKRAAARPAHVSLHALGSTGVTQNTAQNLVRYTIGLGITTFGKHCAVSYSRACSGIEAMTCLQLATPGTGYTT